MFVLLARAKSRKILQSVETALWKYLANKGEMNDYIV